MATTTVSRLRLEDGDLPHVCIKTGEPADGLVNVKFSTLPPWTYLLLLAGIFPFLIAVAFGSEQITAQVPVRKPVVDRYHDLGRRAWSCFGIAIACGVVAVIFLDLMWSAAALAAIAGVLALMQRATGWVDARPVHGTGLVELRGVSTEFASAITQQRTAS